MCVCVCARARYHVGRHVANLQVTNTYEGKSRARSPLSPFAALLTPYHPSRSRSRHTRAFSLSVHAVLIGTDSALAFLPPRPRAGHPHAHPGQSHDRHPRVRKLSRAPQTGRDGSARARHGMERNAKKPEVGRANITLGESFFFSVCFTVRSGRDLAACIVSICCLRTNRKGAVQSSLRRGTARLRTHRREQTHIYECARACVRV